MTRLIATIVVVMSIFVLPAAAMAQGKGFSAPDSGSDKEKAAAAERYRDQKANEAAAKKAMQQVPESKEKYDPWKIAR